MERTLNMVKKYTLLVDCGIPYEEKLDEKKLMKELKAIGKKQKNYPHCDISIHLGKKDVTDSMFKKYFKIGDEK